jgi:hypothetical protein
MTVDLRKEEIDEMGNQGYMQLPKRRFNCFIPSYLTTLFQL